MNTILSSSVCIRCGKQRIVKKTYTETVNNSTVTYEETVCPDRDCQKRVNQQLVDEKTKRDVTTQEKLKRAAERLQNTKDHKEEEEN